VTAVRLGLLADIHEAVEPLAAAVRELKARRVEAFVMLGDVLEAGERAEETVALRDRSELEPIRVA
jgi:predicted phosphodiesterase